MSERLFKPVRDSRVTLSQLMLPSHANFSGKIHGGYLLSLMDQIAFASASKFSGYYCVTASVDTVDFLAPIEIGELVTLKASVNYSGKTSMVVGIRVTAENITTGKVKHCNSSYFTMVAKDESGGKPLVPGLILSNTEEVRRYHHALQRIERRHASITEEATFDPLSEAAFEKLEAHAVKILLSNK